jgi:putative SOS response-associated peptidase YedK
MCGRYTAAKDFSELVKLVGVILRVPFFAPRYNIAPTQLASVIYNERHQPAVKLMRWGLIPSWAKDESVGNALINARSETLESRTAFREAFKQRRCLIPADSFYEWKEMHGERQPFRVMLKSGEPFCFAGLWDRWILPPAAGKFDTDLDEAPASETIESFTIITRAANTAIAPLHDRMPVIMAPNHYGWWLKDDGERGESHKMALGHPLEEPLKIYPVSDLVNSPKTDDARCIEPVAIDRDFFERQWWGDG